MDWTHAVTAGGSIVVGLLMKATHGWLRGQQYGVSRKVSAEADRAAKEREAALEDRLTTVLESGLKELGATFRADLADAENRIFERINGKYLQTRLADVKFAEYDRRLNQLEDGHEELRRGGKGGR